MATVRGWARVVFESSEGIPARSGARQQLILQVGLDDGREFSIDILSYNGQNLNKDTCTHLIDARTIGETGK